MADPFRSTRLIYRAVSSPEDDAFVTTVVQDPIAWQNSMIRIAKPATKKDTEDYIKDLEKSLLGVIICLPGSDAKATPTPIGIVHLTSLSPGHTHHAHSELGIDIIRPYQRQGYAFEAISWALTWAFKTAALHRVNVTCFEWNTGARALYEKLGFVEEGRSREMFWFEGRWWDDVQYGILGREWMERVGVRDGALA